MSTRFVSVRNLFAGAAPAAVAAGAEAPAGSPPAGAEATAGPTQAQVEGVVTEAVAAESKRWHTVMTSDAGQANPKGAAHLLVMAGGAASAEEVLASLDAVKPAAGAAPAAPAAPSGTEAAPPAGNTLAEARRELNSDASTRPDTGPASGNAGDRTGQGRSSANSEADQSIRDKRKARADKARADAAANGHRVANQPA